MTPHLYHQCPCIASQNGKPHCGVRGINGVCGRKAEDPIHSVVKDEPAEKREGVAA